MRGSPKAAPGVLGAALAWEPGALTLVFTLPLICCVTMGKLLAISGAWLYQLSLPLEWSSLLYTKSVSTKVPGTAWSKAF